MQESINPYASPTTDSEPAVANASPATDSDLAGADWHYLDHHQLLLFLGLMGVSFGGAGLGDRGDLLGNLFFAVALVGGALSLLSWWLLNIVESRGRLRRSNWGRGAADGPPDQPLS